MYVCMNMVDKQNNDNSITSICVFLTKGCIKIQLLKKRCSTKLLKLILSTTVDAPRALNPTCAKCCNVMNHGIR